MVEKFIMQNLGIKPSAVSVGRVLKKIGFTSQKPLHQAYQQNPQFNFAWQVTDTHRTRAMAKAAQVTIVYYDYTRMGPYYHSIITRTLKRQTPVGLSAVSNFQINLLTVISQLGNLRFAVFEGRLDAVVFSDFRKSIFHKTDNYVCGIVDNHPAHRPYKLIDFVKSTQSRLKIFSLPPYSWS
jgi:hypothetical protein